MNESSHGGDTGPQEPGGDPPISGGFPPPPHPKEEFPTPPSSAQGQTTDLQLGAFGQEDLGKCHHHQNGKIFKKHSRQDVMDKKLWHMKSNVSCFR